MEVLKQRAVEKPYRRHNLLDWLEARPAESGLLHDHSAIYVGRMPYCDLKHRVYVMLMNLCVAGSAPWHSFSCTYCSPYGHPCGGRSQDVVYSSH